MGELIKVEKNVWCYQTETRLLEFSFVGNEFGFWNGPFNETARSYEGGGCVMPINKAIELPLLKSEYPEFYDRFCSPIEDYKNNCITKH